MFRFTRIHGALALALLLPVAAAAQPAQPGQPAGMADAPERLVWDLRPLFASDAAWDSERQALLAELPKLAALRGTLGNDAAALRTALDTLSALQLRGERVWVYASTQYSTDSRAARNQERMGLMQALWGQWGAARAWVDPEIQAVGSDKVEAFIRSEPGLARHAVNLRQVLRAARHTLGAEAEGALAALGPVLRAAGETRSLLVNADIVWPSLTVEGQTVRVSDTGYERLRQHPDRAVRQQAFAAYFGALRQYENTFGSTLATRVRAGVVEAKLRQYPTAVAATLADDEVPEAVLRMLVAQANAGLPVLHRYFRLRQRMLGLPDLAYHDIYPALVRSERRYPPDVAAQLTLDATRPLGADYQRLLQRALSVRSMHVRPADGKQGGAYQTGVYGLVPFVFLNHQDDYASLSTYAHEWGHGIHTMLAQAAQPYETARYPLFTAEIASTANEVLLSEHMLAQARGRDERLFVLGEALERLRATFFRQTMFAEFELQAHDAMERGEALSGKKFTALYCALLRKYHGTDAGVMAIDPVVCQEWAYIPHFYRPFYVYQYATSVTAATHFAEQVLRGGEKERENYLNVLRAGGSAPPHMLLQAAGVDLATPAPYQALLRRMDGIIDQMERLLDQK